MRVWISVHNKRPIIVCGHPFSLHTYKWSLQNLLSGDAQTQWDRVYHGMHERNMWAGVKGKVIKGRRPHMWAAFQDCLELHKLTVFTADAAKRQRFYIQQAVRKPQRTTVQQHILRIGVFNDFNVNTSPRWMTATRLYRQQRMGICPLARLI